jgi:hypothetical protein
MFPQYKSNPTEIIGSNKNYCKMLPANIEPTTLPNFKKLNKLELEEYISESFNSIYTFVSCGQAPNRQYNRKILDHPIKQAKWHIQSRYYLINLVPLMFKNFRTIEFRLHTPTTNRYKVFNWMLINAALIKYATEYQSYIIEHKTTSLSNVLNTIYPAKLAARLIKYVDERTAYFKANDADGKIDIKNDISYKESKYA